MTVQRCKTVLSSIFTTALNDQIVFLHPCRDVTGPPVPQKPLQIVTPTESESIVEALPDGQWRLLAEVAIGGGLRWGELVELRLGDLDMDSGVLTVARTIRCSPRLSSREERCHESRPFLGIHVLRRRMRRGAGSGMAR
jgi:integrase